MDINQAFETTFRLLLGECNVRLDDLQNYLCKYHYPVTTVRSSISGKPITLSRGAYADGTRFISQDEIDLNAAFKPLDINNIKDLDSIISALGDRFVYTGNKVFGRSGEIENADDCVDSFYVKNSHNIHSSKYVAYSSYVRDNSEFVFGCALFPSGRYLIKVVEAANLTRCFETYFSATSQDLYCCYSCYDCVNAMFSFNLKSKRYCIGNLELPKDKYIALKATLVAEIREYLEKNKDFYAPFAIPHLVPLQMPLPSVPRRGQNPSNSQSMDRYFKSTCRSIFGREIGNMADFERYLTSRVSMVNTIETVFGNKTTISPVAFCGQLPRDRIIDANESMYASSLKLSLPEICGSGEGDRFSQASIKGTDPEATKLETIMRNLGKIALFPANVDEGNSANNTETHIAYSVVNCYRVCDAAHTKNCAYDMMAMSSESVFGSFRSLHSSFCIKCHNSVNLSRCFEMSDCDNCSDSMFCHNCEGCSDCMFCFNVKSKRYAIGNVELGKDVYLKIKKKIVDEITRRFEADHWLDVDIYNIAHHGAKREAQF